MFPTVSLLMEKVILQVIYWLSGLTCTDENFITKAGAQRCASKRGVVLICPDTSPRMLTLTLMTRISGLTPQYRWLRYRRRRCVVGLWYRRRFLRQRNRGESMTVFFHDLVELYLLTRLARWTFTCSGKTTTACMTT